MNSLTFSRLSIGILLWLLLNISMAAVPVNDNNHTAIRIKTLPYTNQQSTLEATNQQRELTPSCMTEAKASVWYTYLPNKDETVIIDTFGSNYDTALSIWTGSSYPSFQLVACNDDSSSLSQSQVVLPVTAGELYWINISGYRGETGDLVLQVQSAQPVSNDQLTDAIEIVPNENAHYISNPINTQEATLENNESGSSCAPISTASIWYSYTPITNQTVVFDTFLSDYDTVLTLWTGDKYPLTEVNCNDDQNGGQSQLVATLTQNKQYLISIAGKSSPLASDRGVTILRINSPPSNDDVAKALSITALPYEHQQNTGGATIDAISPSCAPKSAGVWYQFIPAQNYANVRFSTIGSSYDTVISVWTGESQPTTELACNDDANTPEEQSRASQVSLTLTANTIYYVNVSSAYEETGNLIFKVIEGKVDFNIASQPIDQQIAVGQTVQLKVELNDSQNTVITDPLGEGWGVAASFPFTFQWYQGNINDTTNPVGTNTPIFTSSPLHESTRYWVRVTNATGQLDSIAATITVGDTPLPPDPVVPTNGIGLDTTYHPITTTANFTGLVTKSLEEPTHLARITQSDDVFITNTITVDPQHIGQKADILIVAIYVTNSFMGIYMRNDAVWEEWHDWDIAQLTAAQANITLTNTIEIPIFFGNFAQMVGNYDVYVGYRLKSNADLFYSSESIHFTVE